MFKNLLEALGREEHKRLLELQQEFIDLLPMSVDVTIAGNKLVVSEDGEELFYAMHTTRPPKPNYASSGGLELVFKVKAVESTFEEYYHETVPMMVFCEAMYEYGIVANAVKKHPKFKGFTTSFCRVTVDVQAPFGNLRFSIKDASRPGDAKTDLVRSLIFERENGTEDKRSFDSLDEVLAAVNNIMDGKFPS